MAEAAAAAVSAFLINAGASATVASVASAVTTVAVNVAIAASINAVVANQNKPRDQGGLINLTVNPREPRRLQIGKRLNAGVLVDWYVKGSKNQNLFMVIYLGEGPMGNMTKVYAGGREVYGSTISHGERTTIPNFRSGGDRLWITYYDGRPGQEADDTLVDAGVGWTSNHIGTGCAYAIVECLWDSDNLRSPPSLAFELEGAKLYDRRLDSTAGGSGAHRINNPATWALSDNPAVANDHYLLGRYNGSVKTFGVGVDAEDVPYARFAALANLCDENVDLKAGGTQKRYRSNGFLFADRSYADTIKDLCRAMNARPADFGGRIGVIDSEERTPVLTITDDDVIDVSTEQYTPKRSWGDLVSEVRGTYQNPAQLYQSAEYPRITDAAWVTEDGGSAKEATIDFEMETNAERAQRLAYLFAVRERRQAQLTGVYGLKMIELEQGDWFIRSGGIFGTSPGKVFEVIDRTLSVETMTVTITAFEVDPADSAWDETTVIDSPPAPVSSDDLLQDMEIPALTVTGVTLSGAVAQLPAVKVEWTAPTDPRALQILVEAVPQAGGVPTSAIVDAATAEIVFTNGITDDTDYYVRARFIGNFTPSDWTSTFSVTTTGDYSVGEATSVPWAGLTGDIPDTVDNGEVPTGANGVRDTGFRQPSGYWTQSQTAAGTLSVTTETQTGGLRVRKLSVTGGNATGFIRHLADTANNSLPCRPGDKIAAAALIGGSGLSSAWVTVIFYNASGGYIFESGALFGAAPAAGTGGEPGFTRHGHIATAPALTASAKIAARGVTNNATATFSIANPIIAIVPDNQTAFPPFSPGFDAAPGADVTEDNTAAAITGQGIFATGNYYEQETDPGSVANGSQWFKTDTDELYIRRSGAWALVANIAGTALTIKRTSGDFISTKIGTGTNNTGSVVFAASGGTSPYTYSHALLPQTPSTPVLSLTSATGDTTAITATSGSTGVEVRASVVTTATDDDGNTAQYVSPVYLAWES
jgi:hypothetical protein